MPNPLILRLAEASHSAYRASSHSTAVLFGLNSKFLSYGLSVIAVLLVSATPVRSELPPGPSQIQHIIFVLKENHTFDNYFGTFPGADGVSSGKTHKGRVIPLGPAPDFFTHDIGHSYYDARLGIDKGKMDGFDLIERCVSERAPH